MTPQPETNRPEVSLAQQSAAVSERARQEQVDRRKGEFVSLQEIKEILFGEPDSEDGRFVREQWERLQKMPSYELHRERTMLIMRQTAEKLFVAINNKLKAEAGVIQDTRAKLGVAKYLRVVAALGQSVKMRGTQYGLSKEADGTQAAKEVMETQELLTLETFSEYFEKLNVEELINMVSEDQPYITMLLEEMDVKAKSRSAVDYVPPELGAERELVAADYVNEKGERVDPGTKGAEYFQKLEPANPLYHENLDDLRKLILGVSGDKEKSQDRRLAESMLWVEIVRNLHLQQKEDLVNTFFDNGTPAQAMDFIFACVAAGVMKPDELAHIREGDYAGEFAKYKNGEKGFDEQLRVTIESHEADKKQMQEMVRQGERPYIQNMANHYLTFNNMVMGRVAELGLLTTGLNLIMEVADRIKRRGDPDRKESLAKAIFKGVGDAVKNPWFWLGIGEMAVGTEFVYPWMNSVITMKSGAEEEKLTEEKGLQFVKKQVEGHPAIDGYFLEKYSAYYTKASTNENEGHTRKDGKKYNTFELYPEDVEMTQDKAHELGYANANEAIAAIVVMFKYCADVKKLDDPDKVEEFFAQNEIGHHQNETQQT